MNTVEESQEFKKNLKYLASHYITFKALAEALTTPTIKISNRMLNYYMFATSTVKPRKEVVSRVKYLTNKIRSNTSQQDEVDNLVEE